MPKKLADIFTSTRRPLILSLIAAGLIVLMIACGAFVLRSHGAEDPSVPIDEVDTSRSQIMVTGEGYTLNQSQGVAMEKEQEQRQMQMAQAPRQQQTVGAPSTRYNQISRRYTPTTRPHYNTTPRPYQRPSTKTPTRPEKEKQDKQEQSPKPEKKPEKTPESKPSDKSDDAPSDDAPTEDDDPSDSGKAEPPAGKPVITTDLTNGETIDGDMLNFYVEAKSSTGKKITTGNFTVKVNDTEVFASGSQYKALYSCSITGDSSSPLKAGKNKIKITVKDGKQSASATLRITMNAEEEAEPEGFATLTITANNVGCGTIYSSGDVEIFKGEKIAHFFKRVMEDAGISYESSGSESNNFYLKRIKKNGILSGWNIPEEVQDEIGKTLNEPETENSLGEKDFYPQSGWMFSVNGSTPDSGMASGTIDDGDEIEIWFTLDGGNDEDTH